MDKGKRYLIRRYLTEVILATVGILVLNFGPPLFLVAIVSSLRDLYYVITCAWITAIQFTYFNVVTYKAFKERLKLYTNVMTAYKEAVDVYNTEQSLLKEEEVGPN